MAGAGLAHLSPGSDANTDNVFTWLFSTDPQGIKRNGLTGTSPKWEGIFSDELAVADVGMLTCTILGQLTMKVFRRPR